MRIKTVRDACPPAASHARDFILFSAPLTKLFATGAFQGHLLRAVLLRPLIPVNRAELNRLCRCWRLPIYPDVTNRDLSSPRNRIRQSLLPALRGMFNQNLDNVLSQSAEILSTEQLYINLLASKLSKAAGTMQDAGCTQLRPLPLALKREVLRQFLQASMPERGRLRFSSLEGLLQDAGSTKWTNRTGAAHQNREGMERP